MQENDSIGPFPTPRQMAREYIASLDATRELEPFGCGVSGDLLSDDAPACEDCGSPIGSIAERETDDERWFQCRRCGAKYAPSEMENL